MESPSLFFVYHTANCAAAQGGGSVLSDASHKRTMPGSPKAVKENLEYILPSLEHGVRIAAGLDGECARK